MFKKALSTLFILLVVFNTNAGELVFLDINKAIQSSELSKDFMVGLQNDTAKEEKQVRDLEVQAKNIQADLEKSKGLNSTEELKRKQMQFQKVYGEYQKQGQALQQLRAQKEQAFIQGIRPKLDEVIKQLIQERQISVILNRQSAIYTEPGVDITADVVKKLNELK